MLFYFKKPRNTTKYESSSLSETNSTDSETYCNPKRRIGCQRQRVGEDESERPGCPRDPCAYQPSPKTWHRRTRVLLPLSPPPPHRPSSPPPPPTFPTVKKFLQLKKKRNTNPAVSRNGRSNGLVFKSRVRTTDGWDEVRNGGKRVVNG